MGSQWPIRADQNLDEDPDRWVQGSCFLCSNGCGMDIGVKNDRPGGRIVGVRGRVADVVNRGRLGPKGLYAWVANASPDRLIHPLVRHGDRLNRASWDEAMDLIVRCMRDAKERYTAGSIGFYSSGQLFAEENYTLGVIGKAGIGTLHMDGNTRLCTATAGTALKESFGADGQPGAYEDIDVTDCFLLVGHNMAATDTVLWARALDRRGRPEAIDLQIQVKAGDALRGGVAVIEVPGFYPCAACHASGRRDGEACLECAERGLIEESEEVRVALPPHLADYTWMEIPACGLGVHNLYLRLCFRIAGNSTETSSDEHSREPFRRDFHP